MAMTRRSDGLAEGRVAPPPSPQVHPWRSIVFAPIGDGRRRRRSSDATRLILASLAVLCSVEIVRANLHPEVTVQRVLGSPPDGVRWLVDVSWIFGSWGTVAIILGLAAAATGWHGARGWQGLRDVVASAIGALIVTGVLVLVLGSAAGRPDVASLHGYSRSFPVLHIAIAVAVATAALPYLARTVQRLIEFMLALAVLATVVAGQGLPVNVLGSMAIGWGVTAAVHLAFGSPLGLPSGEEVRALLGTIGLAPVSVSPTPYQTWGPAHYMADMGDDPQLSITFYGRDAAEAQLFTKLWRSVFYRGAGPMPAVTRIQQVEHEASVTLLADRAGARVPEVRVASTLGPSRDAVLITLAPGGLSLADVDIPEITDRQLDDLFEQLLKLREAAISHGALSPRTIRIDLTGGWLTMADFRLGASAASRFVLDQDLAAAIATLALSVGVDRVVGQSFESSRPRPCRARGPSPTCRARSEHHVRAGREEGSVGPGPNPGGGCRAHRDPRAGRAPAHELEAGAGGSRDPPRRVGPDSRSHQCLALRQHHRQGTLGMGRRVCPLVRRERPRERTVRCPGASPVPFPTGVRSGSRWPIPLRSSPRARRPSPPPRSASSNNRDTTRPLQ